MPIEIKEVIIKTNVEKEPNKDADLELQSGQVENLKKEILKSCEHMFYKALKSQTRR